MNGDTTNGDDTFDDVVHTTGGSVQFQQIEEKKEVVSTKYPDSKYTIFNIQYLPAFPNIDKQSF